MAEKENFTNTNNSNPFGNFGGDPSKFFENFKGRGLNTDEMQQTYRKNMQAIETVQKTAAETFKTLAQTQSQFARQTMEDNASFLRNMMASGNNIHEKAALHAQSLKDHIQKTVSHGQELLGIFHKSHEKITKAAGSRMSEYMDEIGKLHKHAGKKYN